MADHKPPNTSIDAEHDADPDMYEVMFSLMPIRGREEWVSIPNTEVAARFAEATNTLSMSRLNGLFAPDVEYTSDWGRVNLAGAKQVAFWFKCRFTVARSKPDQQYRSQVVVLPTGDAGVLTGICSLPDEWVLTQFEVGKDGLVTRFNVTSRVDRSKLRETGYCPPEG